MSFGVPLLNSAKEDTKRLVENENIGYNFHSQFLEPLINELSEISIDKVKKMKKNSYNIFKNKFSKESYFTDMDYVIESINNNVII